MMEEQQSIGSVVGYCAQRKCGLTPFFEKVRSDPIFLWVFGSKESFSEYEREFGNAGRRQKYAQVLGTISYVIVTLSLPILAWNLLH